MNRTLLHRPGWGLQFLLVIQVSFRGVVARKASWFGVLVFGACLLILFPFSFGTDLIKTEMVRLGSFWMIQEFIVVLLVTRIFSVETEHGALELMLHPGFEKGVIVLGKAFFTFLQLCSLQVPICLLWFALYEIPWVDALPLARVLVPVLVFFNAGTASLGVILNGLTARSLGREIVLPILFFPLQVSVLLAAVQLTIQDPLLTPKGGFTQAAWWAILGGFPLIFLALGVLLKDTLFEE